MGEASEMDCTEPCLTSFLDVDYIQCDEGTVVLTDGRVLEAASWIDRDGDPTTRDAAHQVVVFDEDTATRWVVDIGPRVDH